MKNTLIELAKEAGFDVHNDNVYALEFEEPITNKLNKFAELLQANSGNAVDERAAFEEALLVDIKVIMQKYGYQCRDMADEIVESAWNARASLANKPEDAESFFYGMVGFNPPSTNRYPLNRDIIQVAVQAYNTKRSPERWDGAPWGEAGRLNHTAGIKAAIQAYLQAITKG